MFVIRQVEVIAVYNIRDLLHGEYNVLRAVIEIAFARIGERMVLDSLHRTERRVVQILVAVRFYIDRSVIRITRQEQDIGIDGKEHFLVSGCPL